MDGPSLSKIPGRPNLCLRRNKCVTCSGLSDTDYKCPTEIFCLSTSSSKNAETSVSRANISRRDIFVGRSNLCRSHLVWAYTSNERLFVYQSEFFTPNSLNIGRANSCRPQRVFYAGHFDWTRQVVSEFFRRDSHPTRRLVTDVFSRRDSFSGRIARVGHHSRLV